MIIFSTGTLICVPTRDAFGNPIATPTPVKLGILQEVGVDISADLKTLHGEGRYAIAAAQGKSKIEVKAKYANMDAGAMGLFLGTTPSPMVRGMTSNATANIPAASPYTINFGGAIVGGTFVADLGVYFTATGQQFTRVASAPAAGQYSVSVAGVYTFAAADAGKGVVAAFEYTLATGGITFNLANDPMGPTPKFSLILRNRYDADNIVLKLNSCTSASLGFPFKTEDWAVSDFNAQAMADAANNVGYISIYQSAV